MSDLEKKRSYESPKESAEAKRLKIFNEKMALVGFGKGRLTVSKIAQDLTENLYKARGQTMEKAKGNM